MAISKIQSDSITDSAVTSNKISGGAIGVSDLGTQVQGALGTRNLIINGDMRIAQWGTSVTSALDGYNTVDRWRMDYAGLGTWTQSQSTDVPTGQGFANSLKMECTTSDSNPAAGDYLSIAHRMEGQNLQYLKYGTSSAESMTLSFWVKSNKTGTYNVMCLQDDNALEMLTQAYTINTANTWEKKTLTIVGDVDGNINDDNGMGLRINFYLGAGSDRTSGSNHTEWSSYLKANEAPNQVNLADSTSNYINITGVQLEVGDTATPFEHRPYDMELARCQRYYETNTTSFVRVICYSTIDSEFLSNSVYYTITKRTTPAVTLYDLGGTAGQVHMQYNGSGGGSNVAAYATQISNQYYYVRKSTTLGVDKYGMYVFKHEVDAEL